MKDAGWIIGLVGGGLGILGGLVGTYFSIRNTSSPRERALMINASVLFWIALVPFLGLMIALPNPYRHLLWIPYCFLLQLGINSVNRKQQKIRSEDFQSQAT
jgi:uncharacterized membrane protein